MKPNDRRLKLDITAARYLDALERDDFDQMAEIWNLAAADRELEAILRDVHSGLIEEQDVESHTATAATLTAIVESRLPSAEIMRSSGTTITVADVADELFKHTPDRLPAEAHQMNARLRAALEPLPGELGLSKLVAWAEAKFGPAPVGYWKAFRQAAVKLELRRAADAEYHLAARPAPKLEDRK